MKPAINPESLENGQPACGTGPWSRADLPLIIERLQPILRRILGYFEIPRWDAEDLLQGTALRALQQWSKIRQPGPWFVGTLRMRCIEYHRNRRLVSRRQIPLEDGDGWDEQYLPIVPSPAENLETRVDLRRLLRGLSPRQRLLLVARFRLGMVDHEAAELIGVAPSSIRQLTSRALGRMRAVALNNPKPKPRGGSNRK